MKHITALLILIFFPVLSLSYQGTKSGNKNGKAENNNQAEMKVDKFIEKQPKGENNEPSPPARLDPAILEKLDQATREKYFEALREEYSYGIFTYQFSIEVFRWQLFSSKIVFVVVIGLVLSGIYFSGVQFHRSLKKPEERRSHKKDIAPSPSEKSELTEIEASIKGIKVSSPILGVIILIVSFLFFYLYLVYVFPIKEIS